MGAGGGFWDALATVRRRSEDLSSLRGMRLAVDLSFWIAQQEAVLRDRVRKPHLRLTFFRVVNLVAKLGALPIFVMDGEAPPLKLAARIERYRRLSGSTGAVVCAPGASTQRNAAFLEKVEECMELLKLLGVPVLQATGEAEALCAQLEQQGIVDACVTPDSDALLHGARRVIQTLQADLKDPLMDMYDASDIESVLGLGREHLVALALLVGCDYDTKGIPGIGYTTAIQLVKRFPKDEILDQLCLWGKGQFFGPPEAGTMEDDRQVSRKPSHCLNCGHPGNKRLHTKEGCNLCIAVDGQTVQGCIQKPKDFRCSCASCEQELKAKKAATERNWWSRIFTKISVVPNFPDEQILELFLNRSNADHLAEGQDLQRLAWRPPDLDLLEQFLSYHLHWDKEYTRQKTLPLLSFFCLKSMSEGCSAKLLIKDKYAPASIQRVKIQRRKPLYVVKWKSVDGFFEKDWLGLKEQDDHFTTEEEPALLKQACPELVQQFEASKNASKTPKKTKKTKRKTAVPKEQKEITAFFTPVKDVHKAEIIEVSDGHDDDDDDVVILEVEKPAARRRLLL